MLKSMIGRKITYFMFCCSYSVTMLLETYKDLLQIYSDIFEQFHVAFCKYLIICVQVASVGYNIICQGTA
jgi:hypothetical protein